MYNRLVDTNRDIIWRYHNNKDLTVYTLRILGECLLISSLPGKALRTLVDIARLAERFNKRSQSRAW